MPGAKALINLMGFANTYPQIGAISKILSLTSDCVQQFFCGAGFSTSAARRKNVVQPGSLGGAGSPSHPVG